MPKKAINKEEFSEDYCFTCKDGGHLRVCDFKNCLKAYHPNCVGKDPSFLESDERWTCGWHSCLVCQKSSTFQCFCCPSSLCRACVRSADFVQIKKKKKGFCANCLKMAILIEENADVDSDGDKVDFHDTETYEFLFKDYWQWVKDKEGLTLVDLHAADALLKRGQNCGSGSDSDIPPEEDLMSDSFELEDHCDDELPFLAELNSKSRGIKKPIKRSRSKRKRYIGWGSEELIEFLTTIGKDTDKPLSQYDVCEIVKQYIQSNNLFHPEKKKKKVICDKRLYSLFRKKSMKFHKVYSLLENHFAANDTGFSSSSEDINDFLFNNKQRGTSSGFKIQKSDPNHFKEKVLEPCKSSFASIVVKNIQSVYLRRSLILELLKSPEMFENKVMGCFVRVKSDPKDFFFSPLKKYLLGQVTGIKTGRQVYKVGQTSTDVVLRVSNMFKDIQISMLSDEDIEEEECEDLRQLVKKGRFQRPTIVDLERKIRIVHEEIINHWVDRELRRLERLIERANEKGWRRELEEYLDRKAILQKPEERIRLLKEIPEVIADIEEEIKTTTSSPVEKKGEPSAVVEAEVSVTGGGKTDGGEALNSRTEGGKADGGEALNSGTEGNGAIANEGIIDGKAEGIKAAVPEQSHLDVGDGASPSPTVNVAKDYAEGISLRGAGLEISLNDLPVIDIEDEEVEDLSYKKAKEIPVIDLDDDEEEPNGLKETPTVSFKEMSEIPIPESHKVWHYVDPSGNQQGPFSMSSLKFWMEEGFFDTGFKVWRTGQPREEAILLADAIHLTAP